MPDDSRLQVRQDLATVERAERAMLFMVVERIKGRDAKAVYRRLRQEGRGAPEGLRYVDSWVEANLERCFSS